MKTFWFGWCGLLAVLPVHGQSVEELRRQLANKEAETQQLRQRIEVLEREVTPHRIKKAQASQVQSGQPAPDDGREDSNRALERALVRESGLLLPRGRMEVEPNFIYSHSTNHSAALRRVSYGPALVVRAGLPWRSQVELALPYVFERRRSGIVTSDDSGIGDATLGFSHQFLVERAGVPGLIGSLSYTASTGKNTQFESAMPVALGSGFHAAHAALTAIKRVDPLVYFGSYSFTRQFPENRAGVPVAPGNSHGLRFGTALATGPDTSLRAALNLNFYDEAKFSGIKQAGSDDSLALLELGSSVVLSERTLLDVLVGAGLTRNAPNYRISVALPIRF